MDDNKKDAVDFRNRFLETSPSSGYDDHQVFSLDDLVNPILVGMAALKSAISRWTGR